MAFRGGVEDLESHVGPGLGKVVLDEGGSVCGANRACGRRACSGGQQYRGLDPDRWETGVLRAEGWGG